MADLANEIGSGRGGLPGFFSVRELFLHSTAPSSPSEATTQQPEHGPGLPVGPPVVVLGCVCAVASPLLTPLGLAALSA